MRKIHTRSRWVRILFVIATIISLLVSSIIILFFLFATGQKGPNLFLSTNLMGLSIKEKNVDEVPLNKQIDKQIIDIDNDNNYQLTSDLQNNFFLGKTGLDMIKTKIANRIGFGPEFFALKEIIFMEGSINSLIEPNVNGSYFPATQQMIINTSPWINYFQNDWQIRSDYYDDISELLFQVIYHEYGHHKANTYLVNQYNGAQATLNSQQIYSQNNQNRDIEPWNKYFIENFMSNLNYNRQTNLYSDNFIRNFKGQILTSDIIYQNQTKNNIRLQSIGAVYDAQTLFARANNKENPQYPEVIAKFNNNIGLNFSPQLTNFYPNPVLENISFQSMAYLYSMQELFTRKYMQLTFPFKTTKLINNQGLVQSSLQNSDSYFASSYLSDTLNYQLSFDDISGLQYLSDAPFASGDVAQKLINNYHNLNGQLNNTNLSLIWSNNTSDYSMKSSQVQVNWNDNTKSNEIKFGGFLDQSQINQNYQYVGYFDDDASQNFHAIKISTFDYNYNQVEKLGSSKRLPLTKGSKKFYVTDNWADGNLLKNKPLYFASNISGQNNAPLTSTLDTNIGLATTNRFYSPLGSNNFNAYYQAMMQNQKVIISQYQR